MRNTFVFVSVCVTTSCTSVIYVHFGLSSQIYGEEIEYADDFFEGPGAASAAAGAAAAAAAAAAASAHEPPGGVTAGQPGMVTIKFKSESPTFNE